MISIYVHKPSCDCILSRCAGLCWNVYWLRWYGREYGFFLVLSLMLACLPPCIIVLPLRCFLFYFLSMTSFDHHTVVHLLSIDPFSIVFQPSYHIFLRGGMPWDGTRRDAVGWSVGRYAAAAAGISRGERRRHVLFSFKLNLSLTLSPLFLSSLFPTFSLLRSLKHAPLRSLVFSPTLLCLSLWSPFRPRSGFHSRSTMICNVEPLTCIVVPGTRRWYSSPERVHFPAGAAVAQRLKN